MSKKKGRFDAAIWILEKQLAIEDMAGGQVLAEKIRVVIRVLEAAGRVDRSKALDGMEAMRAMMSRELFMNTGPTFQAVYTLLEALPDGECK